MGYQYACVVDDCGVIITGSSEDDVYQQAETHVETEHPDEDVGESQLRKKIALS